jgi:hypothetical protein
MKTWQHTKADGWCGSCGARLQADVPVLVITMRGLTRELVRCPACAGAPIDHEALRRDHQSAEATNAERRGILERLKSIASTLFAGEGR